MPSDSAASPEISFVEPTKLDPCSFSECTAGHRWPPQVALAQCPGCQGPILAVQKLQCPFCNEPVARTVLRSDFVPRAAGVAKRCQGQSPYGESIDLEMQRVQWREVESKQMRLFDPTPPPPTPAAQEARG